MTDQAPKLLEERIVLPDLQHELRIYQSSTNVTWNITKRGGIEVLFGGFHKTGDWENHLDLVKQLANKKFAAPRDKAVKDYFRSYKR